MAVRVKPRVPKEVRFNVEKTDKKVKNTLDHVRRILIDHDYVKYSSYIGVHGKKTALVLNAIDPHWKDMNVQSDPQFICGASSSPNSEVGETKQLPNEGIQASDMCSLLDKFEQAIGNSSSILTPATSPGHSELWNEPLTLKINSQVNQTELTPPTTPPIPEQRNLKNVGKLSGQPKETNKLSVKKITANKSIKKVALKSKPAINKKFKNAPVILKKVKQKVGNANSTEMQGIKLAANITKGSITMQANKRKNEDTAQDNKGMIPFEKNTKATLNNKEQKSFKESQESNGVLSAKTKVSDSSETIVADKNEFEKHEVKDRLDKTACKMVACEISSKLNESKDKNMPEQEKNVIKRCFSDTNCSKGVTNENFLELNKSKDEKPTEDVVKEPLNEEALPKLNRVKDMEDIKSPENAGSVGSLAEMNDVQEENNNEIQAKDGSCKSANNDFEDKTVQDSEDSNCEDDKRQDTEDSVRRRAEDEHRSGYKDSRRKRTHPSSDEDFSSSDDERSNPRRSERYSKRSYDNNQRREKHRKYSSRDDYDKRYSEERWYRRDKDDEEGDYRRNIPDIEHQRKIDFRLGRSYIRDIAKVERRVIYVGGLAYGTTRDELWSRFRKFGPIEKVTVHLRVGERDNYGFVTFFEPGHALDCIEHGNDDTTEPRVDLCFGGRRQFCGGSYVDFDSTNSHMEELSERYGNVREETPDEDDFDTLLRMCQEELRR